ncbi:MAG: TIGR01620 family protein [Alphaproteobacteria bacterium]|nr:TIGR01620 family protein [Alphaproteobacteria bacterium]
MTQHTKHGHRAPQAFTIEPESKVEAKRKRPKATIEFAPEGPEQDVATIPVSAAEMAPSRPRWGFILISALATLFTMWLGLTVVKTVEDFFAQSVFWGYVALTVASVAGLAALAIIIREIWGLARLRRIEHIQLAAAKALNQDDAKSADTAVAELKSLYAGRPEMAWSLKDLNVHADDIMDPKDRVRLVERYLVDPLDETAHRIIARRARRVTLLTTVTPAAALDVFLVGVQNLSMLREIASLYGGRPSLFSTLKLARMVVTHLAVAGGLALTDNFLYLFVGKGILGKLSARFGEGAINGILTARIGLAAREVCRPIPQEKSKVETLSSMAKELANFSNSPAKEN